MVLTLTALAIQMASLAGCHFTITQTGTSFGGDFAQRSSIESHHSGILKRGVLNKFGTVGGFIASDTRPLNGSAGILPTFSGETTSPIIKPGKVAATYDFVITKLIGRPQILDRQGTPVTIPPADDEGRIAFPSRKTVLSMLMKSDHSAWGSTVLGPFTFELHPGDRLEYTVRRIQIRAVDATAP